MSELKKYGENQNLFHSATYHNVYNFMKSSKCYRCNQKIISKFFCYYYYSSKEEFRGSCCSRIIYMTWKNKHRSTTVLEKILLDLPEVILDQN